MTDTYRNTRRVALAVGGALLGVQMALATFSQTPLNPLKLEHGQAVNDYLDPYFAQNWMLFAPNPVSDNRGILGRAVCSDGKKSDYFDVTARGIEKAQASRFFPSRETRIISNGLQNVTHQEEFLNRLRKKQTNDKKPALPELPYEKATEEQAIKSLSRYAFDQMPTACSGGAQKIQIRMYVEELPPWSKRHNQSAESKVLVKDFKWIDVKDLR